MAFSKMAGFEVTPWTPWAASRASSPEVISERRMKSNQTDWSNCFSSESAGILSPFRIQIEDPCSKLQGIFDRKECGLI
jgi:hypothetical protein